MVFVWFIKITQRLSKTKKWAYKSEGYRILGFYSKIVIVLTCIILGFRFWFLLWLFVCVLGFKVKTNYFELLTESEGVEEVEEVEEAEGKVEPKGRLSRREGWAEGKDVFAFQRTLVGISCDEKQKQSYKITWPSYIFKSIGKRGVFIFISFSYIFLFIGKQFFYFNLIQESVLIHWKIIFYFFNQLTMITIEHIKMES